MTRDDLFVTLIAAAVIALILWVVQAMRQLYEPEPPPLMTRGDKITILVAAAVIALILLFDKVAP